MEYNAMDTISSNFNEEYIASNRLRNKTINYIKSDNCIGNSIKTNLFWEDWMFQYIHENYVQNTNIIDLGANIGTTTLLMSEVVSEGCKIYSFEPVYSDILLKNVKDNRLEGKVSVYPYAVGNEKKSLKMRNIDLSDNLNFGALSIMHNLKEGDDTFELSVVPVDHFEFENVSLIKIDVEGMEIEVLEGAMNLIKKCKPTILVETYQLENFKSSEMYKELEGLGYDIHMIPQGWYDYIMKIK
jgi:FkbM family methyltransferase